MEATIVGVAFYSEDKVLHALLGEAEETDFYHGSVEEAYAGFRHLCG